MASAGFRAPSTVALDEVDKNLFFFLVNAYALTICSYFRRLVVVLTDIACICWRSAFDTIIVSNHITGDAL